jgi:hypothetical protein
VQVQVPKKETMQFNGMFANEKRKAVQTTSKQHKMAVNGI